MEATLFRAFKEQLSTFVESMDKPFDVEFLVRSCNSWVDKRTVQEALFQLEEEGRVVRLYDGSYVSMEAARRKWLKPLYGRLDIPSSIFMVLKKLIWLGYYRTVDEALRDAIRKLRESLGLGFDSSGF